jgi:hypothetical protein
MIVSTTQVGKNGFRVVNEYHGFDKFTSSEKQVAKLVKSSRPSDCKSRTYIYRVTDGLNECRVDFDGDKLRDM